MPEKGSALSRPAREPSQQTESGLILPDSAQSLVSYSPQLKHQALVRICMLRLHADEPEIHLAFPARDLRSPARAITPKYTWKAELE